MDKPRLYIPRTVYQQIMHWVNQEDLEVSGMGKVHYVADGNYFYISKVYLLEQEVGAAHTDIDAAALGKLEFETFREDGHLNFWWHSHVKMGVFWSGTDTTTIRTMGANGYCVATVFNQLKQMRTAVCYKASTDFGSTVTFIDECETIIYDPEPSKEKLDAWTADYKAKVKRKVYTYPDPTTAPNWYEKYSVTGTQLSLGDKGASPWSTRRADKMVTKILNSIDVYPTAERVIDLMGKYKNLKDTLRFEAAVLMINPQEYYQTCEHYPQEVLTQIDNKLLTFMASDAYTKVCESVGFEY